MSEDLIPNNMMTSAEWEEYFTNSISSFVGYLKCAEEMTGYIEDVLSTKMSFDELKMELLNFVKDRKAFLEYANDHCP